MVINSRANGVPFGEAIRAGRTCVPGVHGGKVLYVADTLLWRRIMEHANRRTGEYQKRVTQADVARATGLTNALLSKWRKTPTLPQPQQLAAVRDGIGLSYRELLDAALTDRNWLPEPPAGSAHPEVAESVERVRRTRAKKVAAAKANHPRQRGAS